MSTHAARLVTDGVVAALEDAGLTVGDGEKPAGGGWVGTAGQSGFVPYVVVYPLAGGTVDGPIDGPAEDAYPLYQITAVGATRAQCEWAADTARDALLAGFLLAGRRVAHVQVDMLGGTRRDDQNQPPLWYSPDRYSITTTPDANATGS